MTVEIENALQARKVALAGTPVASTGITSADALELIAMLGTDWSSLVREALLLMRGA
jgi:hypothetical protein